MQSLSHKSGIFAPPERKIWPHEMRVAKILASAGHYIEFLEEGALPSADIKIDGIEYEIKSPKTMSSNTLEHLLKRGLKQCINLIIDTSRTKMQDDKMRVFLIKQMRTTKQIKKMLMITKRGQIVDIFKLI